MNKSLCLLIVTNNNNNEILYTLESVYKYINYWIVCDCNSVDETVETIESFFDDKKIPGRFYFDDWVDFDYNNTIAMKRAENVSDYIFLLQPSDIIVGEFNLNKLESNKDVYTVTSLFNKSLHERYSIFRGNLSWKFINTLPLVFDNGQVLNFQEELLSSIDIRITTKANIHEHVDVENLKSYFFDALINKDIKYLDKLCFIIAENYFNRKMYTDSLKWLRMIQKLKNIEDSILFRTGVMIVKIFITLDYPNICIRDELQRVVSILPDNKDSLKLLISYLD